MEFRGIDPDGLTDVANSTLQNASRIRQATHPAQAVLSRNDMSAAIAEFAANGTRTEVWCTAMARDLMWRAAAIREGQILCVAPAEPGSMIGGLGAGVRDELARGVEPDHGGSVVAGTNGLREHAGPAADVDQPLRRLDAAEVEE